MQQWQKPQTDPGSWWTGIYRCRLGHRDTDTDIKKYIRLILRWDQHLQKVVLTKNDLEYNNTAHRHPQVFPVGENSSDADNLLLCATCVKGKLWTMSGPDSSSIHMWKRLIVDRLVLFLSTVAAPQESRSLTQTASVITFWDVFCIWMFICIAWWPTISSNGEAYPLFNNPTIPRSYPSIQE